jgi:hypothetical protein
MDLDRLRVRRPEVIEGVTHFYSHRLTEAPIDVLTTSQYTSSRSIPGPFLRRVESVIKELSTTPEAHNDNVPSINRIIKEPLLSVELFDHLVLYKLPLSTSRYKVKYELLDYHLVVNIIPSFCHDFTAAAITEDLGRTSRQDMSR